jgi:hypothetical protein
MNIKISQGNAKLGSIQSISLPAGFTCRNDCECSKKCYAKRLERMRPSVREAYKHNYELLKSSPNTYWREVEASIMMSRFFRFHVSGDIPDVYYLNHMVDIAERNPHCEILCFTKKYGIVNNYLDVGGIIPKNLHLIFSAWRGLKMENPHGLPEAHVRYRDGTTTAHENAVQCSGNCTECALTEGGCWSLKDWQEVVFDEH